jgi:hypothetical protein
MPSYLKNVLVRFLESPSDETLVPVLCRLLELSPSEVDRIESKRRSSYRYLGVRIYTRVQ